MEQNSGDDRNGGEKIGAELAVEEPDSETKKQGQATCKQGQIQGDIGKRAKFEGGETKKQMNDDSCGRQDGDDSGAVSGLSSEETAQYRSTSFAGGEARWGNSGRNMPGRRAAGERPRARP
jgi:hypothetical protein